MAEVQTCKSDSDCSSVYRCYVDVSWDERESFCDCDFFIGFTGSNCTELNPTGLASMGLGVVFIIFASVFWVIICKDIWLLIIARSLFKKRAISSTFINWLIAIFVQIIQVILVSFLILELYTPETIGNVVLESEGETEKFSEYKYIQIAFLFVLGFLLLAQCYALVIVWLEVSSSVRTFMDTGMIDLWKVKFVIYLVMAASLAFTLPVWLLGYPSLTLAIILPNILLLLVVIIKAKKVFAKSLSNTARDPEFVQILKLVYILSRGISVIGVLFFILAAGYIALSSIDWREYSPRGEVSTIRMLAVSIGFLMFGLNCLIYYYVSKMLFVPLRHERRLSKLSSKRKDSKSSGSGSKNHSLTSYMDHTLPRPKAAPKKSSTNPLYNLPTQRLVDDLHESDTDGEVIEDTSPIDATA